jgi:hypothetical protein
MCSERIPLATFEPVLKWEWWGQEEYTASAVTPLVANFTDDNGDGEIDLCDTPDIVVVASNSGGNKARMFLLSGATGLLHFTFEGQVNGSSEPALGDIDGDGLAEVVTLLPRLDVDNQPVSPSVVAFEHDGTLKWISDATIDASTAWGATTALGNVDNEGLPEIAIGNLLLDAHGGLMANFPLSDIVPNGTLFASPVLADLDGDHDLEILFGRVAYHHDGSIYYLQPEMKYSGFCHVADLDADGEPEILVTTHGGITLLERDGKVVFLDLKPTGISSMHLNWVRPAAIHDFDGDGGPEFSLSSYDLFSVYEPNATIIWSASVQDQSGAAGVSAFDFLGDNTAEAVYADEFAMHVYDGVDGMVLMETLRTSHTGFEYPIVADVDNDGAAEILVPGLSSVPALQVFADASNRWAPARRIWNQHAYHVTNVREDGTIPQIQQPSWQNLNTFRAQAQINEDGTVCAPRTANMP